MGFFCHSSPKSRKEKLTCQKTLLCFCVSAVPRQNALNVVAALCEQAVHPFLTIRIVVQLEAYAQKQQNQHFSSDFHL